MVYGEYCPDSSGLIGKSANDTLPIIWDNVYLVNRLRGDRWAAIN